MALTDFDKLTTILRHPRSRVRLNPDWVAPTLHLDSTAGPIDITVMRNRISPQMWTRFSHRAPDPASKGYFLVQLTARCHPEEIRSAPADVSATVNNLFSAVVGNSWHVIDDLNPQEPNGTLRWNWYSLMTHEELATHPDTRTTRQQVA